MKSKNHTRIGNCVVVSIAIIAVIALLWISMANRVADRTATAAAEEIERMDALSAKEIHAMMVDQYNTPQRIRRLDELLEDVVAGCDRRLQLSPAANAKAWEMEFIYDMQKARIFGGPGSILGVYALDNPEDALRIKYGAYFDVWIENNRQILDYKGSKYSVVRKLYEAECSDGDRGMTPKLVREILRIRGDETQIDLDKKNWDDLMLETSKRIADEYANKMNELRIKFKASCLRSALQ
jgi:hypothetical protein